MELGLSLGETSSKPSFGFVEKASLVPNKANLGFCMALSISANQQQLEDEDEDTEEEDQLNHLRGKRVKKESLDYNHNPSKDSPLIQLDLLPNTPVPRHNQLALLSPFSHYEAANYMTKGLDVNEKRAAVSCSPPTSSASSFQMDLGKSDEDDNGCTRKKLRLSKQQSAFLEESFKEHTTLNPKQKLALANQLNLRPRQVEVWFQNRRARTKLKQTEVDCETLKRCCETLTEENRRLHKEVQELRALKTSNPMYMQLPPTTLTMCPSCERVAATTAPPPTQPDTSKATDLSLSTRPRFQPLFNQPRIS